jgi:hypothetical protein
MMRTRGFRAAELNSKSMDMDSAMLLKEVRNSSTPILLASEDPAGPKCILMKNLFEVGSPNWLESTILKLLWAKKPLTA